MAKRYDTVPWTAVADAPDGVLPCAPWGFHRQTFKAGDEITHYRFVPECGNYEVEPWVPDTVEFT